MSLNNPEPPPARTEGTPVWDLVIADMKARDHAGRQKYGTPLQAHNGRDQLVDAYQEALDLVVYLRAAIEEGRSGRRTRMHLVVGEFWKECPEPQTNEKRQKYEQSHNPRFDFRHVDVLFLESPCTTTHQPAEPAEKGSQ